MDAKKVEAQASGSSLTVNIKSMNSTQKTVAVQITDDMKVLQLKERIESTLKIPAVSQRLIFQGKVIKDDQILRVYGIKDGQTIHLVSSKPEVRSTISTRHLRSHNTILQLVTCYQVPSATTATASPVPGMSITSST